MLSKGYSLGRVRHR